jgi:hypothetical protein
LFYGLLVNGDYIGRLIAVKGSPMLEGHTVIKAENEAERGTSGAFIDFSCWFVLDNYGEVLDSFPELFRKLCQSFLDELLKSLSFHRMIHSSRSVYFSIPSLAFTPFL